MDRGPAKSDRSSLVCLKRERSESIAMGLLVLKYRLRQHSPHIKTMWGLVAGDHEVASTGLTVITDECELDVLTDSRQVVYHLLLACTRIQGSRWREANL